MTWQPSAMVFPDIELELTGRYRAALEGREEPYAQDVHVDITSSPIDPATGKPARLPRMLVVRRDGGTQAAMRDRARVALLVWSTTEKDADDLARLVMALAPTFADGTPIVSVPTSGRSGPWPVADESEQPLRQMTVEFHTRGVPL